MYTYRFTLKDRREYEVKSDDAELIDDFIKDFADSKDMKFLRVDEGLLFSIDQIASIEIIY